MTHYTSFARHSALGWMALWCAAAQAQTSVPPASSFVTLFGVVDAAARYAHTNTVGSAKKLDSGEFSSSRFGFRGQEDLGNNQFLSFWLESFLNIDTGTTTPTGFQRRSTISFIDRGWGEIRLGRDYTPTHTNWANFDPFGYVGMGSVQLLILSATGNTPVTAAFGSNSNDIQRENNTVQYLLPAQNSLGLDGSVMLGAGEDGIQANDSHRARGGRLGITQGPLFISAATLISRDNSTRGAFKDTAIAGRFTSGSFRLSAGVRRLQNQSAAQNNFLVGAVVPFGIQEFKFSWNRAQMHGAVGRTSIDGDRTDQYAVGWVYILSKRTRLFATAATIRNQGNARFVVPGSPTATTGGLASRGVEAGMNHEF